MTMTRRKNSRIRTHEHIGSLEDILATLERGLTSESIMTPWHQVEAITAERNGPEVRDAAKSLMDRYNYSGIPVVWSNSVVGFYMRHDPDAIPRYQGIRADHFVSPKMGLFDLVRVMSTTQQIAVCVGAADAPCGWLTYADFSKRPFRVMLFALVAEIEYLLALALDTAHPDDSWVNLLASGDAKAELLRRQNEAKHWDVCMPLTTFADIGHLIHAVPASPEAMRLIGGDEELPKQLRAICDLRNRVDHVVRPVIAGPKQISSVSDQTVMLRSWVGKWSRALAIQQDAK